MLLRACNSWAIRVDSSFVVICTGLGNAPYHSHTDPPLYGEHGMFTNPSMYCDPVGDAAHSHELLLPLTSVSKSVTVESFFSSVSSISSYRDSVHAYNTRQHIRDLSYTNCSSRYRQGRDSESQVSLDMIL